MQSHRIHQHCNQNRPGPTLILARDREGTFGKGMMKRAGEGGSGEASKRARPGSACRGAMKYIVVTGGIASGLGKGITASSIAVLLQGCGWKVTMVKIDPYLNVDAGTMSPFEHGETFVLDDGGETDLDLGKTTRIPPR
jgi:hypothetical protein